MDNQDIKWYNRLIVKVNWSIIIILIIFILFLGFLINRLAARELGQQVRNVSLEISKSLKNNVNNFLVHKEENIYLTESFIKEILIDNKDVKGKITAVLKQIKNEHSDFKYLYFADKDGEFLIYPNIKFKKEYEPEKRIWYKKAVAKKDLIWTNSYRDANNRYLMITVAKAVRNKEGKILGVVAGDILLDDFSNLIKAKKIGKTGYAYITDKKGNIIAHPEFDFWQEKKNIKGIINYDKLYGKNQGSITYLDDGEIRLASFVFLERLNSMLFTQITKKEAFAVINELEILILIISFMILTVVILTVYYIHKKNLLIPINQLVENVNKVAAGNYNVKIDKTNNDEIGKLAQQFNYMTEEIASTYQQLEAYNQEVTILNKNLKYQANHDPLTGLANRRKFMEKLNIFLDSAKKGAVVLLDFNNFKEINDTMGHVYGDQLLKKFANLLTNFSKEKLFVARYGGDEFLLLIKDIESVKEVEEHINSLEEKINEPFLIDAEEIYLSFSLGISLFPQDSKDAYELITMADTAMYHAKEMENKSYLFYSSEMFNLIKDKKSIRELLRRSLKEDSFELKYQPQIDVKTGKIDCLEALIRLKNNNLSPAEFIPVAEESGLIIDISRWVSKRAIKDLAILEERFNKAVKISINFSVQQLNDLDYIEFISKKIKENGIKAGNLEIEVTESLLIKEKEKALNYLKKLKDLGLKIALDDFGTGYSSLSYLTYISFDKVKVDKTLIERFLESDDLKTMDSLVSFFHSLNLPVVAEGVEELEQLNKLKKVNCDYIQGYLFSRPVKFSALDQLFKRF